MPRGTLVAAQGVGLPGGQHRVRVEHQAHERRCGSPGSRSADHAGDDVAVDVLVGGCAAARRPGRPARRSGAGWSGVVEGPQGGVADLAVAHARHVAGGERGASSKLPPIFSEPVAARRAAVSSLRRASAVIVVDGVLQLAALVVQPVPRGLFATGQGSVAGGPVNGLHLVFDLARFGAGDLNDCSWCHLFGCGGSPRGIGAAQGRAGGFISRKGGVAASDAGRGRGACRGLGRDCRSGPLAAAAPGPVTGCGARSHGTPGNGSH